MLLVVLILYSVLVITTQHHDRLLGDTMVRLSIAEKYIQGDFSNAINGFYGPLVSWILIPFLLLGTSHLFAIHAFYLIIGLLTIIGVWSLSYRFELTEKIRSIILVPLLPLVISFSLNQSVDFLLLCILIFYFGIVFKINYSHSIYNGILSGILGAFAYFAKAYAFPFFLSHFLLINICQYLGSPSKLEKKNIIRNAIAGIILFSIVSAPWIILISNKYNKINFSTSGGFAYNLAKPGPDGKPEILYEKTFNGFREPFNDSAILAWEDPTYYYFEPWSPLQSWGYFKYFIQVIFKNITHALLIYESFSSFSIAIIISYFLLFIAGSSKRLLLQNNVLYPILTMILYTGGYFPFHIEPRYLWTVNILLLLMGGCVLNSFFHFDFFMNSRLIRYILIIFFTFSFILMPLKTIKRKSQYNIDKGMYLISDKLKKYDMQGNFASTRQYMVPDPIIAGDKTYRLAYYLNSRYYGHPPRDISDQDLEKELLKYNIDYYFVWSTSDNIPPFLLNYKELTGGEIAGLKIYSLKEAKD